MERWPQSGSKIREVLEGGAKAEKSKAVSGRSMLPLIRASEAIAWFSPRAGIFLHPRSILTFPERSERFLEGGKRPGG
jgi:hypothetical protein